MSAGCLYRRKFQKNLHSGYLSNWSPVKKLAELLTKGVLILDSILFTRVFGFS